MSKASKAVRQFLRTKGSEFTGEVIASATDDSGRTTSVLTTGVLTELLQERDQYRSQRDHWMDRAARKEAQLTALRGSEDGWKVHLPIPELEELERLRAASPYEGNLLREELRLTQSKAAEQQKYIARLQEVIRVHNSFEHRIRAALRELPAYRAQNPVPDLLQTGSAGSIEFAPEN